MKQKIITLYIQPETDRDRLLHTVDKLLAPLTVLAMLAMMAVACIGLWHELTVSEAPAPVDASATAESAYVVMEPPALVEGEEEFGLAESYAWDVPLTDAELSALLDACEAGHIDPALALALIQVESSFDPEAINPVSGCYGYCQLNPKYFPAGLTPEENITAGIGYLAEQLDRYGDLEAALTAYNAGHDTGDRTYAQLVLGAMEDKL